MLVRRLRRLEIWIPRIVLEFIGYLKIKPLASNLLTQNSSLGRSRGRCAMFVLKIIDLAALGG